MSFNRCPKRFRTGHVYVVLLILLVFVYFLVSLPRSNGQSNPKSHHQSGTNDQLTAAERFAEAERLLSEQLEDSNRRALEKYLEAADLWSSAKKLEEATVALRNAGEVLELMGGMYQAMLRYQSALEVSQKTRNRLEEGRILNDLAYLHFVSGNTEDAHKSSLSALRIAKELRSQELEAGALSNLGEALYSLGDLEEAQRKQQEAFEVWRQLGDQRGQATALIALGYYWTNLAQPDIAMKSFDDGLSLARAAKNLRVEGLALIAIGYIKRKSGEKQEALEAYRAAQLLAMRIGDKTSQAIIRGGMGSIYFEMGDLQRARDSLEKTAELFEINGQKWGTAEAKLTLGRVQHALGNNEKALALLNEALALFRSLSMRRFESLTLRAMGQVQSSLGNSSGALTAYEQARSLTRSGQDQRLESYTLNYIGNVYEELKDSNRAFSYYSEALPLSRVSADPISETLTRYNLAHLERDRGNLDEARAQIEKAIEIVESLRTKVSSQDLRTTYFATVRDSYELYIDILMLLDKRRPNAELVAEAFAISERARARSFLELLSEAQANVREGVDPDFLKKERELTEAFNMKAQRQMQLIANKNKAAADEMSKELEDLTTQLAQVRDQIKTSSPRYAALALPQPLNVKEVQQRVLKDDSLILQYALGNDRSYVWVVDRDSAAGYELPNRREIEESARRLYKLFIDYQMIYGESVDQQTSRRAKAAESMPAEIALLSKLVLGPLAGKLGEKRLLIIPDGALQYIPFQMLSDPDSSQLMLAKHEIVYELSASTLSLLLAEDIERPPGDSVAVLADPVFELDDPRVSGSVKVADSSHNEDLKQSLRDIGLSADGVEIPRLLASKDEAEAIMNSVPWFSGLKAVGFAANRDRVLGDELSNFSVVHFATHGLINNEHPELSGIVLSLFDKEGRSQNGFLRLNDIYNLRMPADLVVLSACSTGLGKDVKGEGLIGLTRGFMYASASSVVASLWKVDDEATAELMRHFYHGMFKNKLTPAAALRYAQLTMSQDQRWHSPYYWAGFIIQGRYDKQVTTNRLLFLTPVRVGVTAGLLTVLILTFFIVRRRRRA